MILAIDLLREWDEHNRPHACYYESAQYDGMEECPSRAVANFGEFLEHRGFNTENCKGQIYGRSFDEPNFWSRNSGSENPVEEKPVDESVAPAPKPKSIAQLRAEAREQNVSMGDRMRSAYYTPTTDEVLRARAQKAKGEAVENDEQQWQVEAMDYFKERLDRFDTVHGGFMQELGEVKTLLSDILTSINALEAKIDDERSESRVADEATDKCEFTQDDGTSKWCEEHKCWSYSYRTECAVGKIHRQSYERGPVE